MAEVTPPLCVPPSLVPSLSYKRSPHTHQYHIGDGRTSSALVTCASTEAAAAWAFLFHSGVSSGARAAEAQRPSSF